MVGARGMPNKKARTRLRVPRLEVRDYARATSFAGSGRCRQARRQGGIIMPAHMHIIMELLEMNPFMFAPFAV